jgi:hypothetical protein
MKRSGMLGKTANEDLRPGGPHESHPHLKIQTNPAVPILGCVDDPWAFHPGLEQD